MIPANRKPEREAGGDDDKTPRMGSEYSTARRYIERRAGGIVRKTGTPGPAHGVNDSDFAGTHPLTD